MFGGSSCSSMASRNGVVFPASMAAFLADPVNIAFGSVPTSFAAPAANLVDINNAAPAVRSEINLGEFDSPTESHPPTPRDPIAVINQAVSSSVRSRVPIPCDLLAGIDRATHMLTDSIKIREATLHPTAPEAIPTRMPFGLRSLTRVYSDMMKTATQIQSGSHTSTSQAPACGSRREHPDAPCPIHKLAKHTKSQCRALKRLHFDGSALSTNQHGINLFSA